MVDVLRAFLPVILALALTPVLLAIHIMAFRLRRPDSPGYIQLPLAFLSYAGVWAAAFTLLPVEKSLDGYIGGLATAGFCCLAYMQMFSLTVRGFSLRIVVDISEKGALTFDQILEGYGGGRGLDWMFEKRVAAMESLGLVKRRDGLLELGKPLGYWAGHIGVWTKRLLKIGAGG